MGRKRKYDYDKDYPVSIHLRVPIELMKQLEELGLSKYQIQLLLENSQIVERFLKEYVENYQEIY